MPSKGTFDDSISSSFSRVVRLAALRSERFLGPQIVVSGVGQCHPERLLKIVAVGGIECLAVVLCVLRAPAAAHQRKGASLALGQRSNRAREPLRGLFGIEL